MFLFFHSKQNPSNSSYYKGVLFEEYLKSLFEKLGYKVTLRNKHNSLEYDIEGEHIVHKQKLIAEAKAHENTIPGKEISAFVGKLLPLGLVEKNVHGLFMSTSSFSPEAEEYFLSLKEKFNITKYCGKELFELTNEQIELPRTETLKKKIPNNFIFIADYILLTDTETFKVLICRSNDSGTPNSFLVFDQKSNIISDQQFLKVLTENIIAIQDLSPIAEATTVITDLPGRIIEEGLQLSTDWTDYKLPASPRFFVGRSSTLESINKEIFHNGTSFIQIKSRSGVGKSSILAYIADKYSHGHNIELHDSRDIKSPLDIFLIIQRFTNSQRVAQDFKEVYQQLRCYSESLSDKAFIFIDQFESTFNNKDIFDSYESLISILLKFPSKFVIILARKNDQLTTVDETKISLEKLNSLSKSLTLQDFTKDEAVLLIKKIVEACGSNLDKEVLSYVLEFSQGFPWLVKRTMAHILKQLNEGTSKNELVATGLMLDDLFNEELEVLDEIQADYLSRIVQNLPANYNQLHKTFDEDPLLTKMLDHLTKLRLIRLSGSTYDTYNDVLKEYILYKKLPHFKQKSLFRLSAGTLIRKFHKMTDKPSFNIDDVVERLGVTKGSAFNFVREWKSVCIVESSEEGWKIPQIVLDVIKEGRLGDYIRRELAKNDSVTNILNLLSQGKKLSYQDIPELLSRDFPFVEASDDTWETYSKCVLSWLVGLKLVEYDKETKFLTLPSKQRNEIISELGNLIKIQANTRERRDSFFPNHRYKLSQDFIKDFLNNPSFNINSLNENQKKGFYDLKQAGWIDENEFLFDNLEEFEADATTTLTEQFTDFWTAARQGDDLLIKIREILTSLGSDESAKYAVKVLLSWGKGLNIIEDKRYIYSRERRPRAAKKKARK